MGKLEDKVNDILGIKEESTPVAELMLQDCLCTSRISLVEPLEQFSSN